MWLLILVTSLLVVALVFILAYGCSTSPKTLQETDADVLEEKSTEPRQTDIGIQSGEFLEKTVSLTRASADAYGRGGYYKIKIISDGNQQARVLDMNEGNKELLSASKHNAMSRPRIFHLQPEIVYVQNQPDYIRLKINYGYFISNKTKRNALVTYTIPAGIYFDYKNHKDTVDNKCGVGFYDTYEKCMNESAYAREYCSYVPDQNGGEKYVELKLSLAPLC